MATVRNPFIDLESNDSAKVEEIKAKLKEQFNKSEYFNCIESRVNSKSSRRLHLIAKDSWLLNGVYDYFMQSQSLKVVDVLAMVNEPHDKYFLDK